MPVSYSIIPRLLGIIIAVCIAITGALLAGQRLPEPGLIVAVMQGATKVSSRPSAPFLRFIDVERGVSAVRHPPVEGLFAMQPNFAPEPIFWLFTNIFDAQDPTVTTTSGFHLYDARANSVTTFYENTVSGYEPVSSAADFRFSPSFPGGGIVFFEPSEQTYYLLSPTSGGKLPLLKVPVGTMTQLWFSRDHQRFAYVRDGHLATQDLHGGSFREYPDIILSPSHNVSWEDNGETLLITSYTDPDAPKYYIDAATGKSVNPAIAELDGRSIRFQPACGPGIISYSREDSGQMFLGDLNNDRWWALVSEENIPSGAILRVNLLPGCTGALIEAGTSSSGRYDPVDVYLSDIYGENIQLLLEDVFVYRRPNINGDYIYGTRTESERLRLYSANLYDHNVSEFERELPDISALGSVTVLDDRLIFTVGNFMTGAQLAWMDVNDNQDRAHPLTPSNETVLSYRFFPLK